MELTKELTCHIQWTYSSVIYYAEQQNLSTYGGKTEFQNEVKKLKVKRKVNMNTKILS